MSIGVLPGSRIPIVQACIVVGREAVKPHVDMSPRSIGHVTNAVREWFESRFRDHKTVAGFIVTEATHIGMFVVTARHRVAVVTLASALYNGERLSVRVEELEEMLNDLAAHLLRACDQLQVQVICTRDGITETWLVGAINSTDA